MTKVPCSRCGARILPTTAAKHEGLCAPCADGATLCTSCGQRISGFRRRFLGSPPDPNLCPECFSRTDEGRRQEQEEKRRYEESLRTDPSLWRVTKSGLPIVDHRLGPDLLALRDLGALTTENQHNPLVAAPCPQCDGRGKWCEQHGPVHSNHRCQTCRGSAVIDRPIRLFDDQPAVEVTRNPVGWLTCPRCRKTFATKDASAWSGLRHRCGQQIIVR